MRLADVFGLILRIELGTTQPSMSVPEAGKLMLPADTLPLNGTRGRLGELENEENRT
jgi:hypothetical protein